MLKSNPACSLCPLHETTERVCVLGRGGSKGMIIGEAHGANEERTGEVFSGSAGQLLNETLAAAGLNRKDFYVTNAVHCRPPDNRTPTKREIKACRTWIDAELKDQRPKFVLLLGNVPLESIFEKKGIRSLRGRPLEKDGVIYLPTYHPAYVLRDRRAEPAFRSDIMTFKSLIEFGGVPREENLNLRIVEDLDDFHEMLEDISTSSFVSYDIETTGLYPFESGAAITLFGVGTRSNQWSLPLQHPEGAWYGNYDTQQAMLKRIVKAATGVRMCAHNAKFDSLWLLVIYGIKWLADFDTMLAHYILDENAGHGLKELSSVFLAAPNYDIDKEYKRGVIGKLDQLALYHAHDLYYTRKLARKFEVRLKEDSGLYNVFYGLIMPVARMFVDVEYEGVYINIDKLKEVEKELKSRLAAAQKVMDRYAPGVNWGSPKQVGEFLFDRLGLDPLDKTAKGGNSTSESVLKRLADQHEVPRELLKFREAKQQLSFFIEGWQPSIVNSRLHPSFKIHGTVTGRLSCENPNLQQVPRDPLIRSLICAPDGWELVEADLSQIELRIAAELANERNMLHAFMTGEDVHWKTVMREFFRSQSNKELVLKTGCILAGKNSISYTQALELIAKAGPDVCAKIDGRWKEVRKKAKAVNFGFLYGMWWPKFVTYARDNYGVIVSDQEAQDARNSFFELYPDFLPWHQRQKKFAKMNGYIRTLTGRKRRLPAATSRVETPESKEAGRQAINSPVQSYANDHNLMAAIEMYQEFDPSYYRMIGTVHDAILQYVRKDKLKPTIKRIKEIMSHPKLMSTLGVELSVPVEADVKIGPWGLGKSEKDYFQGT